MPATVSGSSPRLRGTPNGLRVRRYCVRFIPAFAGNARPNPPAPAVRSVHPRVCGERGLIESFELTRSGSSPRLRGTPACHVPHALPDRFIPAFAGNAPRYPPVVVLATVHPRVCGERRRAEKCRQALVGSSPRLRGTLRISTYLNHAVRFIPAFAGNAETPNLDHPHSSVHPRVCGERRPAVLDLGDDSGSSPRLRGTHARGAHVGETGRFIPAFAGNAPTTSTWSARKPVHPRVCGERMSMPSRAALRNGSSPRLRGTHQADPFGQRMQRFIPAFAGNACTSSSTRKKRTVHPRVCGER